MEFLIIVLLIAAVVAFFMFQRRKPTGESQLPHDTPKTIETVAVGDAITLKGVGAELKDVDVIVRSIHLYDEDGFTWRELECEAGAQTKWIEVERDDELSVTYCETKLKLADVGLTPERLDTIVQKDDGVCHFQGTQFEYDDSGAARFLRDSDRSSPGERLEYWDFESDDGTRFVSVEKWGKGEYIVYYSEALRPSQYLLY